MGGELVSCSSADEGQFAFQGFAAANLTLDGLAAVMPNGLLALTNFTLQTKGHAFNPTPLRFLDVNGATNSTAVARSFSTSFVFAIVSNYDGLSDQGLAFVVAPTTNLSTAIAGQYLGLLNATNGAASDHMLAVELDTIMNPEFRDINSNHVGINVNSLISRKAKPAGYYGDDGATFRDLMLNSREPMQVWVDYDGQARQLNVTLAPAQEPRPRYPLLSEAIDLSTVLTDTMYVGFSSSSGVVSTHHYVLGWSFSLDGPAPPLDFSKLPALPRVVSKHRSMILALVLPLATVLIIAAVLAAASFFVWRRRRFAEVREDWEDEFGPHRFAYKDLFRATDGFKNGNLLGAGGFGKVYKGVLPGSNLEIVVKRVSHDSRQGIREFIAEVVTIGRLRHRNLAQLLGYCRRNGELLLVYDYMENGSLDKYLYNNNGATLDWPQRYWIIKGVASSLLYLHEDWEQVVIHRDIKASNVLLDKQMNGRLGDFGLARLYDHGTDAQTTHVVGTMGYLAPELVRTGKATPSTDVFAFGVVMLVDWVLEHHHNGSIIDTVDPCLMNKFNTDEVTLVLKLGLLCTHPSPNVRPPVQKVMQYLDGVQLVPDLPSTYMSYSMLVLMENEGKMYKHLLGPHDTHLLFKDLWKAASRIRHKIFFWLLLHDRVSSRSLLKRKNFLLQSYECAICQDHVEETSLHLLWDCHFALSC
ncbi:unnamed protein product [Triticum turgidum subsp. durum]|uniref:non-specific serine/threonine protein kinase n=1 Tax=Triticum turgidum subsp. durum TaxID=4567 RepID=A0A9R1R4Z0_TRITD|nr:unnamed protein product [Triticum turgidum subsp. durum]